jgi:hypothetical protein
VGVHVVFFSELGVHVVPSAADIILARGGDLTVRFELKAHGIRRRGDAMMVQGEDIKKSQGHWSMAKHERV